MILVLGVWTFLRALLGHSTAVTIENIALRHQLMVLRRSIPRPRLRRRDRIIWVCLARLWADWRPSLLIVRPARDGPRLAPPRLSTLLALEVPTTLTGSAADRPRDPNADPPHGPREPDPGAGGIQAELRFLGYEVAALTVAKYMRRASRRPSPTWRVFLAAHRHDIAAVDFFVVPTLTFRLLFGFVILRHDRRELLHIGVTDQPTAVWAAQQIVHAFPDETGPAYLLRDRDAIFGPDFQRRVERMGIRQVVIAPRAPWQNPFAERVIGSIRRECLDLVLVLNERHLRRLLRTYLVYYNVTRPHQSLDSDSPHRREVQPVPSGRIVTVSEVGGLHHRYQRAA
jgi:putative transposase